MPEDKGDNNDNRKTDADEIDNSGTVLEEKHNEPKETEKKEAVDVEESFLDITSSIRQAKKEIGKDGILVKPKKDTPQDIVDAYGRSFKEQKNVKILLSRGVTPSKIILFDNAGNEINIDDSKDTKKDKDKNIVKSEEFPTDTISNEKEEKGTQPEISEEKTEEKGEKEKKPLKH